MSADLEKREVLSKERYPLIAFIGPPGSGKTTLVDAFSRTTGAKVVIEPFELNPYLERFYKTGKSAYDCQASFLIDRFFETQSIEDFIDKSLVAADSNIFGDETMFEALYEMGHVTGSERTRYWESAKRIESSIMGADITIYRRENADEIGARVIARNRPMEMDMLGWNPDYFVNLAKIFDRKIMEKADQIKGLVTLETSKFDVIKNPEAIVRECCNRARYLIDATHDMGLGGIGSDGAKLIIPDFLRPPHRDYAQFSWQSSRFDGT